MLSRKIRRKARKYPVIYQYLEINFSSDLFSKKLGSPSGIVFSSLCLPLSNILLIVALGDPVVQPRQVLVHDVFLCIKIEHKVSKHMRYDVDRELRVTRYLCMNVKTFEHGHGVPYHFLSSHLNIYNETRSFAFYLCRGPGFGRILMIFCRLKFDSFCNL